MTSLVPGRLLGAPPASPPFALGTWLPTLDAKAALLQVYSNYMMLSCYVCHVACRLRNWGSRGARSSIVLSCVPRVTSTTMKLSRTRARFLSNSWSGSNSISCARGRSSSSTPACIPMIYAHACKAQRSCTTVTNLIFKKRVRLTMIESVLRKETFYDSSRIVSTDLEQDR